MLTGKIIVVTGGASGIGKTAVELFCLNGAQVIFTDYNEDTSIKLITQWRSAGYNVDFYKMDVTSEYEWQSFSSYLEENYNKIDGLFNNAGVFKLANIAETTLEIWDNTLDVNAKGVFLGIKYISPLMIKSGGGSIVNAGSIASKIGSKERIAYAASKGAVESMTKAAAIELAPYNIRVNSTHPPYVNTPMAQYVSETSDRTQKDMGQRIPLGNRICEPLEVANVVKFLLSEDSSFITGAQIVVDGGQITN